MNGFRLNRLTAAALGISLAFLAACKSTPPPPATTTLNSDGTVSHPNGTVTVPAGTSPAGGGAPVEAAPQKYAIRNPDGSITNPDGSVTYAAGSKVANKENSAAPAPAPPRVVTEPAPVYRSSAPLPPAPLPVSRTIPSGTAVVVRTNGAISAHDTDPGSRWTGSLERPLVFRGATIFAAGTPVSGTVVASKGRGRFKGAGDLGIEVNEIGRERVSTTEYEKIEKGRGKRSAAFTGGGAGLGALIGGLAGGGKGALIGGLAGAGGGAAAGSYTGGTDVVIPAESVISFRLTAPVTR